MNGYFSLDIFLKEFQGWLFFSPSSRSTCSLSS